MKRWIGRLLMGAGIIHILSAVVIYYKIFQLIAERGIFNTVAGDPVIGAFVWSMFFGTVAFCGGLAVDALEKNSSPIPKLLGWCLLALATAGVILVPISGFWLVFPPAIAVLSRNKSS